MQLSPAPHVRGSTGLSTGASLFEAEVLDVDGGCAVPVAAACADETHTAWCLESLVRDVVDCRIDGDVSGVVIVCDHR